MRSTVSLSLVIAFCLQSHFWRFRGSRHAALRVVVGLVRHISVEIGGVVDWHVITSVSGCIPSRAPATQHSLYMLALRSPIPLFKQVSKLKLNVGVLCRSMNVDCLKAGPAVKIVHHDGNSRTCWRLLYNSTYYALPLPDEADSQPIPKDTSKQHLLQGKSSNSAQNRTKQPQ